MISSDLFTYDLDLHPLSSSPVKTHKIRSHVPKVPVSKAQPSCRPLVTSTATSRPMPLQVRIGIPATPFRAGACPRANPCPHVLDRRPRPSGCAPGPWTGCLRAGLVHRCVWSQFFEPHPVLSLPKGSQSWCRPLSSSLMPVLNEVTGTRWQ